MNVNAAGSLLLLGAARAGDLAGVTRALLVDGVYVDHTDAAGDTALSLACQENHAAVVDLLLASGASVYGADSDGDSALMCASWQGYELIVDKLLAAGAAVDHVNHDGATALMCATENGHTRVAERLLLAGARVDRVDNDGDSALMCALLSAHIETVRCLLAAGADFQTCNNKGETPAARAKTRGHAAIVQLFREYESSLTTLFAAAENGRFEDIGRLLPLKRVDKRGPMGRTVAHSAAHYGRLDILQLLVDRGAKPHLHSDAGWTPLHHAANGGHATCVRFLLDLSAHVDLVDKEGLAAIDLAARNGHQEIVFELHQRGASLQNVSNSGLTILHHAIKGQQTALVVYLLNHGAVGLVDAADHCGWTPLHYAVDAGDIPILSILLLRGADPNRLTTANRDEENDGWYSSTALHMAVSRGNVDAIAVLVASGRVDATIRNGNGDTPLALAVSMGMSAIVALLVQLGVDGIAHNQQGETRLSMSETRGYNEFQRLLQERDADANDDGREIVAPLDLFDHQMSQPNNRSIVDDEVSSTLELLRPADSMARDRTDDEQDSLTTSDGQQCQYRGGKCKEPRTTKINGTLHKLCHQHRLQQNEKKRRSSSKRKPAVDASGSPQTHKRSRPLASAQCQYAGRPCTNLRDHKPNGDLHLFCTDHRRRHNTTQRSVDRRRVGTIGGE